jgi:uncharacterized protein YdaU (DUF1376 family)
MAKTEHVGTWMPYRITDMREDCIGQPLEFKAMYINLLEEMWRNNGQLDDSEAYLARVSGATPSQWIKHRQALANLFYIGPGNWQHNRLREELAKAHRISEKRREAGTKAINARWAKARVDSAAVTSEIEKDGTAY